MDNRRASPASIASSRAPVFPAFQLHSCVGLCSGTLQKSSASFSLYARAAIGVLSWTRTHLPHNLQFHIYTVIHYPPPLAQYLVYSLPGHRLTYTGMLVWSRARLSLQQALVLRVLPAIRVA